MKTGMKKTRIKRKSYLFFFQFSQEKKQTWCMPIRSKFSFVLRAQIDEATEEIEELYILNVQCVFSFPLASMLLFSYYFVLPVSISRILRLKLSCAHIIGLPLSLARSPTIDFSTFCLIVTGFPLHVALFVVQPNGSVLLLLSLLFLLLIGGGDALCCFFLLHRCRMGKKISHK